MTDIRQLFVIIDTCSMITHRAEFIDFVTNLGDVFEGSKCPIRFIISLPVLEELDKYNRRPTKRTKNKVKQEEEVEEEADRSNVNNNNNNISILEDPNDPVLSELLAQARELAVDQSKTTSQTCRREPPRMFMRFIEEEMRIGHRLIGELDPGKELPLRAREINFEIVNKDDRILECCVRSRAFIQSNPHHPDTSAILVTEDNVFKSKATTFDIPSYRWREFSIKYKNFGLKNYTSTPLLPSSSSSSCGQPSSIPGFGVLFHQQQSGLKLPTLLLNGTVKVKSKKTKRDDDDVIIVKEVIDIK